MPEEVAARELGQRTVPVDRAERAEPIVGEDVGLLAPAHRAPHDQPAQRRQHQDVHERLALGADAFLVQALAQLPARERPFRGERALDDLDPALGRIGRDAFLGEAPRAAGEKLRRRQGVEPRVVLGADEVKRAAVEPADDERAVVECAVDVGEVQPGCSGADREPGAAQVLCLNSEQPLGDRDRVAGRLAGQQLGREPLADHRAQSMT